MSAEHLQKAALRKHYLAQRRLMADAEREHINRGIANQVLNSVQFQSATTIFCYISVRHEIDTHLIIQHALAAHKTICVPRCGIGRSMTAHRICSLDELTCSSFGIPEPPLSCPVIEPNDIDLCLVPALACDRLGYRLGYGGGYYDRYLKQTHAISAALCAEARICEQLPHNQYDVPCQIIFTEGQVIAANVT